MRIYQLCGSWWALQVFVIRKPDTIKETIVQVRKSPHARILLHEIVNWRNIAITLIAGAAALSGGE